MPSSRFLVSVALVCLLGSASVGLGQNKRPTEKIRTSGTVTGGARGILLVTTEEGDQYRVKVPDKPENVTFGGSAVSSWLQPGMWVSFSAKFTEKGAAATPVTQLTVFTPKQDSKVGVFPDSGFGGADLFGDKKPEEPKEKLLAMSVSGRLTGTRNGALTVAAGTSKVKVDLADTAKISVNVSHLNFISPGDKVSIDGWYYPQQKRDVVATRLTVTAAETLGAPKQADKDDKKK